MGQCVYWNASSPRTGRAAEHAIPYGNYPPYISISGGAETTPVDKWAAVVFELFNLQNFESFTRLAVDATAGKVKADEYAVKCVMLEYDAQLRTHKLFAANPLPDSPHGRDHWYNAWVRSELLSAEDFRTKHAVPGDTHCNYDYFKNVYATRIAPFMPGSAKPSIEPTNSSRGIVTRSVSLEVACFGPIIARRVSSEVARLVRIPTRSVSEVTTYVAFATRVKSPSLTRRVMISNSPPSRLLTPATFFRSAFGLNT